MAARHGIGKDTVALIWRDHELRPWKVDTFMISNDPDFEAKLVDVVGLYLNPPERAGAGGRAGGRAGGGRGGVEFFV